MGDLGHWAWFWSGSSYHYPIWSDVTSLKAFALSCSKNPCCWMWLLNGLSFNLFTWVPYELLDCVQSTAGILSGKGSNSQRNWRTTGSRRKRRANYAVPIVICPCVLSLAKDEKNKWTPYDKGQGGQETRVWIKYKGWVKAGASGEGYISLPVFPSCPLICYWSITNILEHCRSDQFKG